MRAVLLDTIWALIFNSCITQYITIAIESDFKNWRWVTVEGN
ncbi:hypothetical protein LX92_03057 [Maribacter polysiphoniae]|uniref:Uncharacterized protein n=1 Tax=Maribacter polysiphoniae TaxID=429344 RepID=A0A316DZ42_9FLAO|nr:hypothetical protein LX92_03057 [Maribacter polysiphoniae]